jgi:hypothetical protein
MRLSHALTSWHQRSEPPEQERQMAGARDGQRRAASWGYAPRCSMSLEAISWALVQAPDVPPECVSLLVGLANHADTLGRGAYAGQKLMAAYARKSDRSVRNDLGKLINLGLIRHGDQRLAAHIPADCRPVVYDLAMERKCASARNPASARHLASAATSDRFAEARGTHASDQQEREGSGSVLPPGSEVPGGSEEQRERKPASYKPTDNPMQNSPTESSYVGGAGEPALFDAEPQQQRKARRSRKAQPAAEHPRFAEWYDTYPVHRSRGDAAKAYTEAVAADADPDVLLAAAKRYRDDDQVARGYGKYPATWLHKQCWLDEALPAPRAAATRNGHQPYRNPADQSDYDLGFTDGR